MFYYLAGFFHTQCFLHFLFLQHNIPSRTSAALVGSNLTLPMSISRNLHAILLFQLHELDKRRMNFWVTIWKITIACLGFSPRFHSAYCKWISTRALIMDRNLFFVFTNYIVLKLLNACISIVHVPAYSRFPPWRLEMVSKLSLSYGRKIHCWNTHYLKQVNVLNIFGLRMILTYHMVALILIDFLPWCQGMSTARLFGVLVRKFHTGCPATSGPRICSMMLSNLSLHHKFWNDWNEDILY